MHPLADTLHAALAADDVATLTLHADAVRPLRVALLENALDLVRNVDGATVRAERCAAHLVRSGTPQQLLERQPDSGEWYTRAAPAPRVVKALLDIGLPLPRSPIKRANLLGVCIYRYRPISLAHLLQAGAAHDLPNGPHESTLISTAAANWGIEALHLLRQHGFSSFVFSDVETGRTPLHSVTGRRSAAPQDLLRMTATLEFLLQAGIPPLSTDTSGHTPLAVPVAGVPLARYEAQRQRLFNHLLDYGLPGAQQARTSAAACWNAAALRVLAERGIDLAQPEPDGRSLLHVAATATFANEVPSSSLARVLQASGNRVPKPRTPDEKLFDATVAELAGRGVAIDARDAAGRTPIMAAVHPDGAKAVRVLVAHGADISARDDAGRTVTDLVQQARDAGTIPPRETGDMLALLHAASARQAMNRLLGAGLGGVLRQFG